MCTNKYFVLKIVLSVTLLTTSCSLQSENIRQKPYSKEAIQKYVKSGFISGYGTSRLFCDKSSSDKFSRIEVLLDYLGYADFEWPGCYFNVSGNQRYLRLQEHYAVNILIIGKDTEPQLYDFPHGASWVEFDNDNKLVAWGNLRMKPRGKVNFANGETVTFPAQYVAFDNAGELFCSGGLYFDYESETRKEIPLYIYSVHNPLKPLIRSGLSGAPDGFYTTRQKVYLIMRNSQNTQMPYDITCEIYNRQDNELELIKTFIVKCPRHFGARWFYPEGFDESSNLLLLQLAKEKFFSPEYYLLNMENQKLTKINNSSGDGLYLIDPNMLQDIIAAKTDDRIPAAQ